MKNGSALIWILSWDSTLDWLLLLAFVVLGVVVVICIVSVVMYKPPTASDIIKELRKNLIERNEQVKHTKEKKALL